MSTNSARSAIRMPPGTSEFPQWYDPVAMFCEEKARLMDILLAIAEGMNQTIQSVPKGSKDPSAMSSVSRKIEEEGIKAELIWNALKEHRRKHGC